jgi:hypothetical protein
MVGTSEKSNFPSAITPLYSIILILFNLENDFRLKTKNLLVFFMI